MTQVTTVVKRVDGAFVTIPFWGSESTYSFDKYESIAIEEGKVVFTLDDDYYQVCRQNAGICACCVCKVYKRPMGALTMEAFRKTNGLFDEMEEGL